MIYYSHGPRDSHRYVRRYLKYNILNIYYLNTTIYNYIFQEKRWCFNLRIGLRGRPQVLR